VLGGRRDQHEVTLDDVSLLTGNGHLALATDDHVCLLGLGVRVWALLAARRHLHPGDHEVAGAKLARVEKQVRLKQTTFPDRRV
jgi:hypothetical protein